MRHIRRIGSLFVIFILLSFPVFLQGSDPVESIETTRMPEEIPNPPQMNPFLTASDPIRIDSNSDLNSTAALEGWSGNGSEYNPFLISDLSFDLKDSKYGIYIGNTSLYVLIRDCYFTNSVDFQRGTGIDIYNSTRIYIINCSSYQLECGIVTSQSKSIFVINSTFTNDYFGFSIFVGYSLLIQNCSIINAYYGIYSWYSDDYIVLNCSFYRGTIGIKMDDSNNIIIDSCDFDRFSYSGIRVIGACNNNVIRGCVFTHSTKGIEIDGSNSGSMNISNNISCCEFINNNRAVYLEGIHYCTIDSINISGGNYGIYSKSSDNNIFNNISIRSANYGLMLEGDRYCRMSNISMDHSTSGIGLDWCGYISLSESFIDSERTSLDVSDSYYLEVKKSILNSDFENAVHCYDSDRIYIEDVSGTTNSSQSIRFGSTRRISIVNSDFTANEQTNILLDYYCNNITIDGCNLFGSGLFIFFQNVEDNQLRTFFNDLTVTDTRTNGKIIRAYKTGDIVDGKITNAGQVFIYDLDHVTIGDSHFDGVQQSILILNSNNISIKGCSFNGSSRDACLSVNCTNVAINNSRFTNGSGIMISRSDRVSVCENYLRNQSDEAISIWDTQNVTIAGNQFMGTVCGINLWNVKESNIFHNNITGGDIGILLDTCSNTNIQSCNLFNNRLGIHVFKAYNCVITNNIVVGSKSYGIILDFQASGIWVHHNAFSLNNGADYEFNHLHVQGLSNSINCIMAGGEKKGGNYWGDWNTPDDDLNGIVDNPYLLDGSQSKDNYPLTRSPVDLISSPRNVSVEQGSSYVRLRWNDRIESPYCRIVEFRIYRGLTSGKEALIGSSKVNAFLDDDVKPGVNYTYYIVAYGDVGEGGRSESVWGMADDTPPFIEVLEPKKGLVTNRDNITVIWKANEIESAISGCSICIDGGDLVDVGSNISHEFSGLIEGSHEVHVRAMNTVGLTSMVSVRFTVDLTVPEIDFNAEDPYIVPYNSFDISWSCHDDLSGVDEIRYRIDDHEWVVSQGDDSVRLTAILEGPHSFEVMATDEARNTNSSTLQIIVDLTRPAVKITSPSDGDCISTENLTIEWIGEDIGSYVTFYDVFIDNEIITSTEETSYIISDVNEGSHSVKVTVHDASGQFGNHQINIKIDRTCPIVDYVYPLNDHIPSDTSIYATFSEDIDPERTTAMINGREQSFSILDSTIFINRDFEFQNGNTYEIMILTSDLAGNQMPQFNWSFTIEIEGMVRGRILDGDGNPLIGAELWIDGMLVDKTNRNGNFTFTWIMGNYTMLVNAPGFENGSFTISVIPEDDMDLGDLILAPAETGNGNVLVPIMIIIILIILILIVSAAITIIIIRSRSKKKITHEDREQMLEILKHFGIWTRIDQINCYETLEIDRSSTPYQIKKAYRRLAKSYHPDRFSHNGEYDEEIDEKIRDINAAKQILLDPVKKELHDRILNTFGK